MSTLRTYRISQVMMWVAIIGTIWCLSHLSPWAPARHNKLWFGLFLVAVTTAIGCTLCYYYFRAKLRTMDTGAVAVQALANAGKAAAPAKRNGTTRSPK